MGNTHVEPATKKSLLAYMEENDIRTPSRGIDRLLADRRELLIIRRENELLHRLLPSQTYEDALSAVLP